MLTPRRVESEELLDAHDAPRDDMERSLRDLRLINKYFGGVDIYQQLARKFAPRSIVDIGAGTCDNLDAMTEVPLRVGMDFKIDHLLYMRDGSRVHRVVGDAHHLPFRDGAVDLVTSAHFFHHFSPEENGGILRESLRVARKGVAVNDTRRSYAPLLFVRLMGLMGLIGRITRYDAPASVRQAYTVDEAREMGSAVRAKKVQAMRVWPFRMGLLLWK